MESLLLWFLFTKNSCADSFVDGIGRINAIHDRANDLLNQAGVLSVSRGSDEGSRSISKPLLTVHDASTGRRISEGTLFFGKTKFRLLVGSQPSPVQVKLAPSEPSPWTEGLILTGSATQNEGRIFIEFDRLLSASGKAFAVSAVALDQSGSLGLKGSRENSKLLEIAGGTALGLLTAPDETPDILGYGSLVRKSGKERMRESLLNESKNYIKDELKETPVLRLEMDTPLTILIKSEVKL